MPGTGGEVSELAILKEVESEEALQAINNHLALEQNQLDYRERMANIGYGNPSERVSGFPMPELYNQHYINKYSFPKGLSCVRKDPNSESKKPRQSIYDMNA